MGSRNMIELTFCDDESPKPPPVPACRTTTSMAVKHDFNGLIIEVLETDMSKPASATIELKFEESKENAVPKKDNQVVQLNLAPVASKAIPPVSPMRVKTTLNTTSSSLTIGQNQQNPSLTSKAPTQASSAKPATALTVTKLTSNVLVIGDYKEESAIKSDSSNDFIVVDDSESDLDDEVEGAAGLWLQEDKQKDETPEQSPKRETKTELPAYTDDDWVIFSQYQDTVPEVPLNKLSINAQDFVCSLCEGFIVKGDGVTLKCFHEFCRSCLSETILNGRHKMGEVKCPLPVEDCEGTIVDEELKQLLGDDYETFTSKIAQQLQEDFKEQELSSHYDILPFLLNDDDQEFIENFKAFECAVCFGEVEVGQGIILKNCLHNFCKECLIGQVKHSEEFEVKCPHVDPDHGNCTEWLQEREIRYLVPAEVFEKHLEKSLKLYEGASEDAVHCKTPDCRGFVEVDKNQRGFTCQVCKIINCIGCKAIHVGKNCQEYQDQINPDGRKTRENEQSEMAIKNLIAADQAMWCPRCEIPVMKDEGCDFIKCTACQLGICWRTKKPRHAITKSNGVVIDGCHCKENGQLCHPKCGNCH